MLTNATGGNEDGVDVRRAASFELYIKVSSYGRTRSVHTYLSGGQRILSDGELVRGESPNSLLVCGVAELVEGLVALGGQSYEDKVIVLWILANWEDQLVHA
jgi:hypothetical protein